ncbi:MAG TPA: cysteine--tRNA ligase [Vicinamibacterales bacterium]
MLRLYNTLTRQEETFEPLRDGIVRMYACGPTVYARAHIGNFRYFVCVDVLRRTLKHLCGYTMREAINLTDVDDKTIAGAQAAGVALPEYTEPWIRAFREDMDQLGIEPPEEMPRATDQANLRAMGDLIAALDRNGHTYARDGSTYFKISTLPDYGKLARLDHEGMKSGVSVDVDEYSKDDVRDFVLWKASRPGEPTWDVGSGPGRPGWHLECSAMALRLFGEPPIDIHAGGIDLLFPHHENEIAQSEGATGKPFSRFWVHVEHLFVEHEKMSKSIGNVHTLPDVVARGHRPSALRYLLLSSHYRKQLNFTWAGMDQAEESLRRIVDFLVRLETVRGDAIHDDAATMVARARDSFRKALESDLNTAAALAAVFDLVSEGNSAIDARRIGAADATRIRETIEEFDRVLGVVSLRRAEDAAVPDDLVREIEQLVEQRRTAKQNRDFATADQIRKTLAERGILLEDSPTGTRWKRK